MQIEILINSNSYQTWSLFLRSLFRFVTQSREAKKRPRRRLHASLTSVLEHSDVFFLLGFFLCACILWDAVSSKTNCLLKKSEICSLMFFQLLEHKQSQMKTAATMAPNRRLHMHACFYFLRIYSLLYAKKYKTVTISSSRFKEHK